MKNFIITIALVILFAFFQVYHVDANALLRQQEMLKYATDEAAASASLFYSTDYFGEGEKIFTDEEALNMAVSTLEHNLDAEAGSTAALKPLDDAYWQKDMDYTVWLFDDSGKYRKYENKTLTDTDSFDYGYMFTEPTTGYNKLITEPTVIVTVNAGPAKMRLSFLQDVADVVETSGYEYLGY